MFRLINRTTLIFFGLFVVASAGVALYDVVFVWPEQQCVADGAWWDSKDHQCLTPIPIWRITGRKLVPAAQAPRLGPSLPPVGRVRPQGGGGGVASSPAKPAG